MNMDLSTPPAPFLEVWAFTVTITPSPTVPNAPRDPWEIRNQVVAELRGDSPPLTGPEEAVIRRTTLEIVADRLSCPDFLFFVTDFEERPGSWEIAFVVVGAFYGGVCGYGAFRQGLEYVYSDLKAVFGGINGLVAKVRKRFKDRHIMSKPGVDPTAKPDATT